MANIKVFKVSTGEELIGDIDVIEPDGVVEVKKPRCLVLQQIGANQYAPTLAPWMYFDQDAKIRIKFQHVMTDFMDPGKDLEDGYIKNTTNIQIATGK